MKWCRISSACLAATRAEFRQFASFFVARQKIAETLVTTDTVRQQVTDQVMAEASKPVQKGTVAHILINVPQGADAAADAAALAKAKDIIARLDKGEKFEDLAKQFSEDPGSKDKGGVYEDVPQGQFVPEFDKAMFQDLKPGETTKEPVKTQFGYHIIKLISRSEGPAMTEEQAKQQIESQIAQQVQQQRGQAFEKLLADEHAKAKQDGRLVEPAYPDPTAAPAPAQPCAYTCQLARSDEGRRAGDERRKTKDEGRSLVVLRPSSHCHNDFAVTR